MKKIFLFITVIALVFSLFGCAKKVDRSKYDEGDAMDASSKQQYSEENPGDPYAQEEIGHHRAYRNLVVVFGNYDSESASYVKFEYVKDVVYNSKPCYVYSKKISKTQDGEYKHDSYVGVAKDGSEIFSNVKA
ncbi:MAG: hypothetical protein E7568_03190 [Ruminococcaceae bacterium]|nr:hypothetical protein [Oscillospiraceae bacterium]